MNFYDCLEKEIKFTMLFAHGTMECGYQENILTNKITDSSLMMETILLSLIFR